MNQRFMLGSFYAFVVYFLGGWLIWGIALMGTLTAHTLPAARALMINPPNFGPLILSNIIMGVFFTWILSRLGATSMNAAIKAAVIISVMIGLSMDLLYAGLMNMYDNWMMIMFIDVVGNAVMGMLAGVAVSFAYRGSGARQAA